MTTWIESVDELKTLKNEFNSIVKDMELGYDLRMVSVTSEDWKLWDNMLEEMVTNLFRKMYSNHQYSLMVSRDSELRDEEMYIIFYSEIGKVELVFDFNPKTLEITYKDINVSKYEEIYLLWS